MFLIGQRRAIEQRLGSCQQSRGIKGHCHEGSPAPFLPTDRRLWRDCFREQPPLRQATDGASNQFCVRLGLKRQTIAECLECSLGQHDGEALSYEGAMDSWVRCPLFDQLPSALTSRTAR